MKKINSKFLKFLICSVTVICMIWAILELAFYGEIQLRIVDDCISVLWIIVICLAYKFKEYEQIRRFKKIRKGEMWWLRSPNQSNCNYINDKIWIQSQFEENSRGKI